MRDWQDLKRFAEAQNFVVTSTTGGSHNSGSLHFLGLAIDVRTRGKTNAEIERFTRRCEAIGVRVRDERTKPLNQKSGRARIFTWKSQARRRIRFADFSARII